jgi:leucyl/phenylalanyl-tRNA---protein transferase
VTIIPPEIIIEAYSQGYFPMGVEGSDTEIAWYGARKRGIIPLDSFHIPRRVLRRIRSYGYLATMNTDFESVINGCAAARESTWINKTIHDTFVWLHLKGLAHSVEVWREGRLCGGLYGIVLGRAFFAESVYQSEPECMKIALKFCHDYLIKNEFALWDVQFQTPFLAQFGCKEISEKAYMKLLQVAL